MPTYTVSNQELTFLNNTDGKNVKKYINKDDLNHRIIRYIKDKLETPEDYSMYGKYRSVIANKDNFVIAFSPPKSVKYSEFIKKNDVQDVIVEELVEGTMINLFFDEFKQEWEIATRSNIGAKNKFVQENEVSSFRVMFLEACNEIGMDFEKLPKGSGEPNSTFSYSFVMQHPKNRIVSRTMENKCWIYLIEMYELIKTPTGTDINCVNLDKYSSIFSEINISRPKRLFESIDSYDKCLELVNTKGSWCDKNLICFGGYVIRNVNTNERTKVRDKLYEYIRRLRGNQIKPKYHYLTLRKQKKIQEYLKYYPEDKNKFDVYRREISNYVYNLWQSYIGCYIKKEKPVKDWPRQFRVHMFNIHSDFKETRNIITLNKTYIYFNKLHESQQMFVLNYIEQDTSLETQSNEIVKSIIDEAIEKVSLEE